MLETFNQMLKYETLPSSFTILERGLPDPYLIDKGWVNDPSEWPDLCFVNIYCYLVDSPGSFTGENSRHTRL
jgi:hypothetical protein